MRSKYFAFVLAACFVPRAHAQTFDELSQAAEGARLANELTKAEGLYQQALQINPQWTEGWWFLGSCFYGTQHFSQAREAFSRVTELNPSAAAGWALKGLSEVQTGAAVPALADVQKALALGAAKQAQFRDTLLTNEALLLTSAGKFDQSLRILTSFAHGDPNTNLLSALGLVGLRRAMLPDQIPSGERDLVATAGQGLFLMLAGKQAEAEEALQKLTADHPSTPGVHYLYGYSLIGRDRSRAMTEFRRELENGSTLASAANAMIAYCLFLDDKAKDALPVVQAAVREDANSPSVQYVLGRVLSGLHQYEGGVAALERAVQLDPENLESRISLAEAYADDKRFKEAAQERQQALRLDSGSAGN